MEEALRDFVISKSCVCKIDVKVPIDHMKM